MAIDTTSEPGKTLKRLDTALSARQTDFTTRTNYLTGNAPLPEGAKGLKEAYTSFQKRARTNFAEIIVQAPQQRMSVCGFRIEDSPEADKWAKRVWSVNEMDVYSSEVHGDMLGLAYGYAIVGEAGEDGIPVITREDPRQCITEHHPLRPSTVTAALKRYTDSVAERDYAYLYLPGEVYVASKENRNGKSASAKIESFDWENEGNPIPLSVSAVPVVCFANHGPRAGSPMAEFDPHTDLLDRINDMVLQRIVIVHTQAFRQRALKPKDGELPKTEKGQDADGNLIDVPIDYNAVMCPAPGRVWGLPPNVDLWESQPAQFQEILNAVKEDARHLAAVSSTPLSMLHPEGENQSAEAASLTREALIFKTYDRIKRATYAWNKTMQLAFAFAGQGFPNVETEWLSPELVTLSEKADAWSKMPDMPFPTKLRDIMGWAPDKVDRIMGERMADVLAQSLAVNAGGQSGV